MKPFEDPMLMNHLEELVALGKKNKNVLSHKEIIDFFGDIDLDPDQMGKAYEWIENHGIEIPSGLDEPDLDLEKDKELDLAAVEGTINIDDHVRMYLKKLARFHY